MKANCMGFSESTPIKQSCLRSFLRMHIKIVCGVISKNPWAENKYLFFDINSGSGEDADGNCGSPIIFVQEADLEGAPYHCFFVDQNADYINALQAKTAGNYRIKCVCAKQSDAIRDLLKRKPNGRKFLGLLYTDPNGIFDYELVSDFSGHKDFERVDILINCNSTAIKRLGDGRMTLADRLAAIPKKHWLIREPVGKWQWTMLFGCNWAGYPELKQHKFYKTDSKQGAQIFRRLNLTSKEIKKKPTQLTMNIFEQMNSGASER